MNLAITCVVVLVALLHAYFLVLEMFLWTRPRTGRAFGLSVEQARLTSRMAANQGLYNGFLAAGLAWSLLADPSIAEQLQVFFLTCVAVAGIYGAQSVNPRIFFIQGLPALVGLALMAMS